MATCKSGIFIEWPSALMKLIFGKQRERILCNTGKLIANLLTYTNFRKPAVVYSFIFSSTSLRLNGLHTGSTMQVLSGQTNSKNVYRVLILNFNIQA